MADKITVIACEQDGEDYKILLSNGTEERSGIPLEPGDEWAAFAALGRAATDVTHGADDMDSLKQKLAVFEADNATLQRGLDEANAAIANLTNDLMATREALAAMSRVRALAPVPAGLIGVTTAQVDNLPSLEQLPAHPTMVPPAAPGEPETPDQRDVRLHIERKRAARAVVTDEGTKPQE